MKIDKGKMVISVESELTAGAWEVAQALAGKLRMPCYGSEEILREATELSGISLKLLRRYEEKRVRHAYDLTAEGEDSLRIPPARDFLTAQIAAVMELAAHGPCVIVDHHANSALSSHENHVSIFVHAQRVSRLERYAAEKNLTPDQAARRFALADRERSRYFRGVNPKWGKASNYDLTVNAETVMPEVLAGHIIQYLETVTQEKLVHPTLAQKRSA